MLVFGSSRAGQDPLHPDDPNYTDETIGDPNDKLVHENRTEWVKEGTVKEEDIVTEEEVDPNY